MRYSVAIAWVLLLVNAAPATPLLPDGAIANFGRVPFLSDARIEAVEIAPDGKLLATLTRRSVTVWDTATGQPRYRWFFDISPYPAYQRGVAFSPDSKRLACGPSSELTVVYDLATGKELRRFKTPFEMFGHSLLRFSADGKALLMDSDGVVSWMNVESGGVVRELPQARICLLSPDDRTFVAVRELTSFQLGDTDGKFLRTLPIKAVPNEKGIVFLPDGESLAAVHRALDETIEVQFWNYKTGKRQERTWSLPKAGVGLWNRLALSADGKVLYSTLRRYSLETNKELPAIRLDWTQAAFPLPDGKTLLGVGLEEIRRVDLTTAREISRDEDFGTWRTSALSPDGRWLALRGTPDCIELCDTQTHKSKRIAYPWGNGATLAFAADSKALIVNGYYHLDFLSVPELTPIKKLKPAKAIDEASIHVSPDGRHLVTRSSTSFMRVFDLTTEQEIWSQDNVWRLLFTPDGKLLIHSREDAAWRLHELPSKKVVMSARQPVDRGGRRGGPWVSGSAFSPDGRRLAVAMSGGQVCLLDAATGRERARFLSMPTEDKFGIGGSYNHATAVALSPNGQWLAVGGTDGFLRLWDVNTRRELFRLHGHAGSTQTLGFSADGRRLVSFGEDEAFVWDLRPPSTGKELDAFAALLSDDELTAYRAIWALASDPKASAMLRARMAPQRVDTRSERVAGLIADLDSSRFPARQSAMQALAAMERHAAPALTVALKKNPSLETRRRMEELLAALDSDPEPPALRLLRAVHALELNGSVAAEKVLREWADGTPGLRLTDEARAALARLP